MDGRERLLTAINNGKPDRLPCQVHSWMQYYLDTYLGGMDQYQAYEYFGMDYVVYVSPNYGFEDSQLKKWQTEYVELGVDRDGNRLFGFNYTTPEGSLRTRFAANQYTGWQTEYLVKDDRDMELFLKYYPMPIKVDWTPVREAKMRVGNKGIVRSYFCNYGQPGIWQSITELMGVENAIMRAIDDPDFIHNAAKVITEKSLKTIEAMGKIELDLIENGGGAASSTVISPSMYREFCLPYDKQINSALKAGGTKVVYHLCGGLMPLLEIVAENGADCLETMTPPSMGGDCRLAEARKRVGDKLAFIGGFDQNAGFEKGNPDLIRKMVFELFEACPDGGYICSPSDHFFFGPVENIRAFVEACKECRY